MQKILRKTDSCERVFINKQINLDERDAILEKLFKYAITIGFTQYSAYKNNQSNQDAVDETNWLKRDNSFYQCLKALISNINDDPKLQLFKTLFVSE